jgi:hypothetical protein
MLAMCMLSPSAVLPDTRDPALDSVQEQDCLRRFQKLLTIMIRGRIWKKVRDGCCGGKVFPKVRASECSRKG